MNFRKKLIVTVMVLIYAFISVAAPFAEVAAPMRAYAAETVTILTVTSDGVNVRTGAGVNNSRITVANEGDVFTVTGQEKDDLGTVWYGVAINGKTGYIISKYVKISTQTIDTPTSASATSPNSAGNIVIVTGSVANIRSEASASSSRIAVATRGETYKLLDKTTDSSGVLWYKISVGDKTGFISSAYGTVKTTATTVGKSVSYITVTGGAVNIRSAAGTSASRIDTLHKGDQYTVQGTTKDSGGEVWYKINVNGRDAYIMGKYVSLTSGGTSAPSTTTKPSSASSQQPSTTKPSSTTKPTAMPTQSVTSVKPTTTTTKAVGSGSEVRTVKSGTVSISSGKLYVRSGAGKSYGTIGALEKGTRVVIVGSSSGWYKIEYSGSSSGYGYVSGDYIKDIKTETTLVSFGFGTEYYYVNVGSTVKVSAAVDGYTVTYTSDNPDCAPVDPNTGVVTGKTPGMYRIGAKAGDRTASTNVVVLRAPYEGIQPMTISMDGVEFIAQWEGGGSYDATYNQMTFTPYKDEVGYWTIGYGHAKVSSASKSWSYERAYSEFNIDIADLIGKEHIMTDAKPFLTQDEAYMLLNADLVNNGYVGAVSNWAMRNGVKLSQQQFDALVSFAFNLGPNYWNSDTYLFYLKSAIICRRSGNEANADQIIEGFCRYMKAGGMNLKGLWWRRRNEAEMFISGDYAIDRENKFTLPNVVWG